jgi:flagellar protein FlbD
MIRLSRINHHEVAINCDLIEWVEANPDTTVRMVSGESILVLEQVEEVIRRIVEYRRSIVVPPGVPAALLASAGSGRPTAEPAPGSPRADDPAPRGAGR